MYRCNVYIFAWIILFVRILLKISLFLVKIYCSNLFWFRSQKVYLLICIVNVILPSFFYITFLKN